MSAVRAADIAARLRAWTDTMDWDRELAWEAADLLDRAYPRGANPICGDTRCAHPRGWHVYGVGSCLECGCLGFDAHVVEGPSAVRREWRENRAG